MTQKVICAYCHYPNGTHNWRCEKPLPIINAEGTGFASMQIEEFESNQGQGYPTFSVSVPMLYEFMAWAQNGIPVTLHHDPKVTLGEVWPLFYRHEDNSVTLEFRAHPDSWKYMQAPDDLDVAQYDSLHPDQNCDRL